MGMLLWVIAAAGISAGGDAGRFWGELVVAWMILALLGLVVHWIRENRREQDDVDELIRRWRDGGR